MLKQSRRQVRVRTERTGGERRWQTFRGVARPRNRITQIWQSRALVVEPLIDATHADGFQCRRRLWTSRCYNKKRQSALTANTRRRARGGGDGDARLQADAQGESATALNKQSHAGAAAAAADGERPTRVVEPASSRLAVRERASERERARLSARRIDKRRFEMHEKAE